MAGSQYLKSESWGTIYLTRQDKTFGLAYFPPVPDAVLMMVKQLDLWHWHDQGWNIVCEMNDEEEPNGSPLDGRARFLISDFVISFSPSKDTVTFIVFDPDRPEMKSFEHLHYFPPDRRYAVEARLIALSEPDEVMMLTSQNLEKVFFRYAKIEFRIEGEKQELTAFKYALSGESSSTLFIPFKDGTTGRESYGAGRFLEIDEPAEENFVLDFNRSFNPLCNYSPACNCPIPPQENHLAAPIRAGEKTYPP